MRPDGVGLPTLAHVMCISTRLPTLVSVLPAVKVP
jgi:hypothetical protein